MAAEQWNLEEAEQRLPGTRAWVQAVMQRLAPLVPAGPLDVLEIGAAQGRELVALAELGHRVTGVEPHAPAIEVARQLLAKHGVTAPMHHAQGEQLPLADGQFDVVLAFSVLEHVDDLPRVLAEIHRVLKPGGVLWFNSASAMSPLQEEIRYFPLFGWYPQPVKRKVMLWCTDHWPAAVNHTRKPALWWWTHGRAQKWLRDAGFSEIHDRWQLRAGVPGGGMARRAIQLVASHPNAGRLVDVIVPGCSYCARKPA